MFLETTGELVDAGERDAFYPTVAGGSLIWSIFRRPSSEEFISTTSILSWCSDNASKKQRCHGFLHGDHGVEPPFGGRAIHRADNQQVLCRSHEGVITLARPAERRKKRYPVPSDDFPPVGRPASTLVGIISFEGTTGELAEPETLTAFYPEVSGDELVWATGNVPI